MHLESQTDQTVTIGDIHTFSFQKGETIHTESSHKFEREELNAMAREAGFDVVMQWVDEEWPFAETLWIVPGDD
jgi:uncharacterized SAM-dependent methyltransferase